MYLEFEDINDQNSNFLGQNFVITWEKEIMNRFLYNLLLGNVLVIVHIRAFSLCARHTKLSQQAPPVNSNTLSTSH